MDEKNKEQINQIRASESGYKITDWKLFKAKQLNNGILIISVFLLYICLAGVVGYLLSYEHAYNVAFNSLNNTCHTLIEAAKSIP